MSRLKFVILLACSLFMLPVTSAWSDSPIPDTDEIIRMLKLKAEPKPKSLDRSWSSSRGIHVENASAPPADLSHIDLAVNFEYNSAQLSTDAQFILNRLGRALNSDELRSQKFKITGHTDAIGTEAYNLDLSRRRAISVEDYLVQKQHIGIDRLEIEGKGYSQLADPAHPTSGVNRRVQVLNLGS